MKRGGENGTNFYKFSAQYNIQIDNFNVEELLFSFKYTKYKTNQFNIITHTACLNMCG